MTEYDSGTDEPAEQTYDCPHAECGYSTDTYMGVKVHRSCVD
jgi:hypothetical protein